MNMIWSRLEADGPAWNRLAGDDAAQARTTQTKAAAYRFELRPLLSCNALLPAWHDLVGRAVEPNVFAGPEMLLAAAQHLPARQPPMVLLVYATHGTRGKLLALVPLETARSAILPDALRSYATPYHPVCVPLVDKAAAVPVLRAVLGWMAGKAQNGSWPDTGNAEAPGMIWKHVPLDGPFARAAMQAAQLDGHRVDILDRHDRAVLQSRISTPATTAQSQPALPEPRPAATTTELTRCRKRLAKHGALTFEMASSGQPLRDAIERFMVLEAASWKGERGSAMVQNTRTSCFLRTASRMMSQTGKCNVMTLFAGDTPVAATITLESATRSWGYKIAYDASFAKASPGLILLDEIRRGQAAKPFGHVFDSCLSQTGTAIAQFWPDRASYGDLMIATAPADSTRAVAMRMRENIRRRLRATAKTIYRRAKGYTR
jgi:hypothetical protein